MQKNDDYSPHTMSQDFVDKKRAHFAEIDEGNW